MHQPFDDQRVRALLEQSLDALALVGSDGAVLYVSAAITRVLGYTPAEFVAMKPFEVVHPDERRRRRAGSPNSPRNRARRSPFATVSATKMAPGDGSKPSPPTSFWTRSSRRLLPAFAT